MSNIFDEAIADAKRLKEIAEQNAKNRIIEAVTPKIKRLIEAEISGDPDLDADLDDEEESDEYEEFDAGGTDMEVDASGDLDLSYNEPVEPTMPDDFGMIEDDTEDYDIDDDLDLEIEEESPKKNVVINVTVESARKSALNNLRKNKAKKLLEAIKNCRNTTQKQKLLSELATLRNQCISSNSKADKNLARKLSTLLKETKMSRRTRKNWFLFEGEGEGEEEDLDLGGDEGMEDEDMDLEDEGDADIDVDAIKAAIEDLADAVGLEVAEEDEDMEDEDMEDMEDEEPAMPKESYSPTEQMREYVEKVNGGFGAKIGGDNGQNTKSALPSKKNDMGGTASNIVRNTVEKGAEVGKGSKIKGSALNKQNPTDMKTGNINVPGGKAGKAFSSKQPGHGAEKKGKADQADKSANSTLNKLSSRAK